MSYFDDYEDEIIYGGFSFTDLEDDFYSGRWDYVVDATPERKAHAARFGLPTIPDSPKTVDQLMKELEADELWSQSGGYYPPGYDPDNNFDEPVVTPAPKMTYNQVPTFKNGKWVTPGKLDIPEVIQPEELSQFHRNTENYIDHQ